jgi:hypothetical protein
MTGKAGRCVTLRVLGYMKCVMCGLLLILRVAGWVLQQPQGVSDMFIVSNALSRALYL